MRDFGKSDFQNKLLVIWLGKDATEDDVKSLKATINSFNDAEKHILLIRSKATKNFSPAALRKGTHFITTREITTLEALDYLWDTDVKIIYALDDGIFSR